jgi:hypothetical protein
MPLSEDEFTCLMIMRDGENMIRMKDTRWYRPLCSLHERDLIKPIGSENFVITQKGLHELTAHESGEDAMLRQMINRQGAVNANRLQVHEKMQNAVQLLGDAARLSAATTGDSPKDALRKIAHEVLERALAGIA